jgi:dTMP kinase
MSLELFSATHALPGMLVTIDGPNGSGKTALTTAVGEHLRSKGELVHETRQPSPTAFGDQVRSAEPQFSGRAFACLVAADRQHQAEHEIAPKLASGAIVVCDRYVESSLVLQRIDEVDVDYILAVNAGIPRPTMRVRLLATPDVLAARVASRGEPPERRLQRSGGPVRELELYAEAEDLLATRYALPATTFDTSSTRADEVGEQVARQILKCRESNAG